jgi:hypothetical protein
VGIGADDAADDLGAVAVVLGSVRDVYGVVGVRVG